MMDVAYRCWRHGERRIAVDEPPDALPFCCRQMASGAQRLVREARAIHGDRFDLSSAVYAGWKTLLSIVCRDHGPFWTIPRTLCSPSDNEERASGGCGDCRSEISSARQARSLEEFVALAKKKHGDRYDYSQVVYVRSDVDVTIICREHGPFDMRPSVHVNRGAHCGDCSNVNRSVAKRLDRDTYIAKARSRHGARFEEFDLIDDPSAFGDERSLIRVWCRRCGVEFSIAKRDFATGRGHGACAMGGFNYAAPALVYEIGLRLGSRDALYWKIGVTNGSIRERMAKDVRALATGRIWLFEQGKDALALEGLLKEHARRVRCINGHAPKLNGGGETELHLEPVVEAARAAAPSSARATIEALMARAQHIAPSEGEEADEDFRVIAEMRAAPHVRRGGKPTVICGFEFPSRVAAAEALGLTGGYVSNLAAAGRLHVLVERVREWLEREARKANSGRDALHGDPTR